MPLGQLFSLQEVDKAQFKVGSIDQLMEIMDSFGKLDIALDNACKRNEKLYYDLAKELKREPNLVIEMQTNKRGRTEQVKIQDYIKNFSWDHGKFQMNKSMKFLATKIQAAQKQCDDRLKKILDEQNGIKSKLQMLQKKKESSSYMQKDLGDLVYEEKISKNLFVNTHGSHIMTTILIVVPKNKLP